MALNKTILKSKLKEIMTPATMPKSNEEAAKRMADAYHQYAQTADAGTMKASGLNKAVIEAGILGNSNFFSGCGSGIQAYWTAATWAGPGFTGVTASAAGLGPILMDEGKKIQSYGETLMSEAIKSDFSNEIDKAASQLADAFDKFTKSITVTATNVSSGATTVVTLI